jgi:hypothetical protein
MAERGEWEYYTHKAQDGKTFDQGSRRENTAQKGIYSPRESTGKLSCVDFAGRKSTDRGRPVPVDFAEIKPQLYVDKMAIPEIAFIDQNDSSGKDIHMLLSSENKGDLD